MKAVKKDLGTEPDMRGLTLDEDMDELSLSESDGISKKVCSLIFIKRMSVTSLN